jgi:hypothetical protein
VGDQKGVGVATALQYLLAFDIGLEVIDRISISASRAAAWLFPIRGISNFEPRFDALSLGGIASGESTANGLIHHG